MNTNNRTCVLIIEYVTNNRTCVLIIVHEY